MSPTHIHVKHRFNIPVGVMVTMNVLNTAEGVIDVIGEA